MSDQNLTPEVATQVNATYTSMLNNFRKITSWLKHGTASEHKLPAVVLNFLTKVDGIEQTQAEQVGKLDTLADIVDGYEATICKLEDTNTLLVNTLQAQGKLIATLTTKLEGVLAASPADAPANATKKRTKKAQEAVQAETTPTEAPADTPKDKVQVTAEAVNAGDVSPEGFAQIDNIIDGLFAGVSAPQAAPVAPVAPVAAGVADLEEI